MTGHEDGADTAYGRALADPAFLARFAAAYTGPGDPLDALAWLDRPDRPGPSGAEGPDAAVRAARAALYRPGTDPAALDRYERAAAEAERYRAAVEAALDRLPVQGKQEPAPAARAAAAEAPAARRRRGPVIGAAAALLLLAVAAGFGLGRLGEVAPAPGRPLVARFQQTVAGHSASAVFDRAAEPADLLGGVLEPLDTLTLRRLVTVGDVRFLAARTRGSDAAICLLVTDGRSRVAARCVALARFGSSDVTLTTADGLPSGFARVRWSPDGLLRWWSPAT